MTHDPCFDAGHGNPDPGAVGHGIHEDDVNLKIALKCEAIAKRQGWKPYMTRKVDRITDLGARGRMANKAGCDAFVSIHVNSTGQAAHGFEEIVPTTHDVKASWRLADYIHDELAPLTSYKDVGVYSDRRGLAVLRGTDMPATLVEVLSVSDDHEAPRLKDDAFLTDVATQIIQGLCRFYGVAYIEAGATPPPRPKPHPSTPMLNRGDHGAAVKRIQKALGITPDGDFGPKTEAAVRAFQKKHHLTVDGVVGPKTWAAILAA